jgi:uncharacterized membrane protein YhaH (DUF805 family)
MFIRSSVMGLSVTGWIAGLDLKARAEAVSRAVRGLDLQVLRSQGQAFAGRAALYLREVGDPRGRCNRKAFLSIALAFLAIQFGCAALLWLGDIEMSQEGSLLLNAPILWIGTTVCLKRLHDVGLRGWWLPGAFAIWFTIALVFATIVSIALGAEALEQGKPAFYAVFAVITLPSFGALLWLHTAPSVMGENVHGPVPGASGLSMPARVRVAGAATMSSALLVA